LASVWPHARAGQERVLLIAIDGARASRIQALARRSMLPRLGPLLSARTVHGVRHPRAALQDSRHFWRTALSVGSNGRDGRTPLWSRASAAGIRTAVIGVPGTGAVDTDALTILPGPDVSAGFIGDNVGRVVNLSNLQRAGPPWPYAVDGGVLARSILAVPAGDASRWMAVDEPTPARGSGMFRAYRLDEDVAYLSPVYRTARAARAYSPRLPEDIVYVADDPGWTTDSSRLAEYYYRHVRDVTNARAVVATDLAADHWPLLVYFDPLLSLVRHAYSGRRPGEIPNSRFEEAMLAAYRAVDSRVGALVDAAGPGTALVLVMREPRQSRQGGAVRRSRAAAESVLVARLVADRRRTDALLPVARGVGGEVLRLFGLSDLGTPLRRVSKPRMAGRARDSADEPRTTVRARIPLTVDSLRELGLLEGSTQAPVVEGAAEVSVPTGH
jgi:hypothetical protein